MRKVVKITLVLAVVLPFSSLVLAEDVEPEGGIVSAATHELNWVELPESGGIKYANVRGDIVGEGPYEAFVLFPAGKDNPFHYHSEAIPTVVIQGTFYAEIDGERTEYPAGSFYDVPGKKDHYSGCLPGMDCLLFQYQEDRFDLVPQPEE